MLVLATNIPRLMKDGFHWSAADVIPADSFVTVDDLNIGKARKSEGWKHTKTYSLQDSKGGKEWQRRSRSLEELQPQLPGLNSIGCPWTSLRIARRGVGTYSWFTTIPALIRR
jgi:hypothetical protein